MSQFSGYFRLLCSQLIGSRAYAGRAGNVLCVLLPLIAGLATGFAGAVFFRTYAVPVMGYGVVAALCASYACRARRGRNNPRLIFAKKCVKIFVKTRALCYTITTK